jgi:hypothetical protein
MRLGANEVAFRCALKNLELCVTWDGRSAMTSDTELRPLLREQPLQRMRWFAALLGWRGLQLGSVCDFVVREGEKIPVVVIYYYTTDAKFFLQINTFPHGQTRTHRATVRADRYGIFHVGWRDFELNDDGAVLEAAERLKPWLGRRNFKDRKWRRRLATEHPELPIEQQGRKRRR